MFRDIKLLGIDNLKIETDSRRRQYGDGSVYSVSDTVGRRTQYFISNAPKDAEAKIKGDRALYKCPKDKEIIKGDCLNRVLKLVDDANLHCRKINAEHERMQAAERQSNF